MPLSPDAERPHDTAGPAYTRRLATLEGARWKRILDVQRPYRWNLRRLDLGRTLDVGCGIGRNLAVLAEGSVGVDHNPSSVAVACGRGLRAMTPEEFSQEFGESAASTQAAFDALLLAHVLEHVGEAAGLQLVKRYLPHLRAGGSVVLVCPQEQGYANDETHVRFLDFAALTQMAQTVGLHVVHRYSFPFPRLAGRAFIYNEFVLRAQLPARLGG